MKSLSSLKWVFFAVLAAIFFRLFVISIFKVPTISMSPAILKGDYLLSFKLAYGLRFPWSTSGYFESTPKLGDIVVFKVAQRPGQYFVKRIVAIAGQTIEMSSGQLLLDSKPCEYQKINLQENSLETSTIELCGSQRRLIVQVDPLSGDSVILNIPKTTVPENSYYVLGDHRQASEDSRQLGFVKSDQIVGKASLVLFSMTSTQDSNSVEKVLRKERFLTTLH